MMPRIIHVHGQVQELMQLAPECPEFPDLLSTIKQVNTLPPPKSTQLL
jgi:hypothetical protein